MKDIQIGDEYWTWIKNNNNDIPIVKKIIIKDIFTIMVIADVNGSNWSIEIPKEELYQSQEEALNALQKTLDGIEK